MSPPHRCSPAFNVSLSPAFNVSLLVKSRKNYYFTVQRKRQIKYQISALRKKLTRYVQPFPFSGINK
jgi:hypothetical protein